mmetsp:Transcript_110346/g.317364  ORF Transcript_110346/g.317364 Transcript_110346/m.317364 type:complete len:208 (-) Transcript_110346:123-746(-)
MPALQLPDLLRLADIRALPVAHEDGEATPRDEVHGASDLAFAGDVVSGQVNLELENPEDLDEVVRILVDEVLRGAHCVAVQVHEQGVLEGGAQVLLVEQRIERLLVVTHLLVVVQTEHPALQVLRDVQDSQRMRDEGLVLVVPAAQSERPGLLVHDRRDEKRHHDATDRAEERDQNQRRKLPLPQAAIPHRVVQAADQHVDRLDEGH